MAVIERPTGRRRRPSARPIWMGKPSIWTQAIKAVVLILIVIVMLYPFWYVISVSLSNSIRVLTGALILWPQGLTLDAYRALLSSATVPRSVLNSIGITIVGTAWSMVMTVTLAYGLTRTKDVPGSRVILFMVLFTLLFGAGIIPNFLLVKYLGMLNSYTALIVPQAIAAFNLVIIRNFFMSLPQEILEAARMDGASDWRVLWSIALPLSKAALAAVALFYGVGYWNNFFNALLYITDPSKWPVQLVLYQYVIQGTALDTGQNPAGVPVTSQVIQMAVLVMATLPILVVYPWVQRYFIKGALTGAVKA